MEILKKIYHHRSLPPTKMVRTIITLSIGVLFIAMQQIPQDDVRENQLKAVFIYNFTQFVEWPSSSFTSDKAPFIIGVLGKNSLGTYLEEVSAGETVAGHPIEIKYFRNLDSDISECQILFIHHDYREISKAASLMKGKPVLTMSDNDDFMKHSGMVRFYMEGGKIRFEVNQDLTTSNKLSMSSKLLRVATLYKENK